MFYLLMMLLLAPVVSAAALAAPYAQARQVRCRDGPDAARPLYTQLLLESNNVGKPDLTTATLLGASEPIWERLVQFGTPQELRKTDYPAVRHLLETYNYTAASVGARMGVVQEEGLIAPWFCTPSTAGTVHKWPFPVTTRLSLDWLVALFLMGLAVPRSVELPDCLNAFVAEDPSLSDHVVAVVPIVPVTGVGYVVTDWHPRVLSTVKLSDKADDEAAMYVGPDSLALVEHWTHGIVRQHSCFSSKYERNHHSGNNTWWLDLCSGSGIQALAALQSSTNNVVAVSVDTNLRALRLCQVNAALNGIRPEAWVLVQGDVVTNRGRLWMDDVRQEESDLDVLLQRLCGPGGFQMMSVNPPFLPVPPRVEPRRHGLFSSGGPTGEQVMHACLNLAEKVLGRNGRLGVVTELFWGNSDADLLKRLARSFSGTLLILTNRQSLNVTTYSERRADSRQEFAEWTDHLRSLGVQHISPGLIFGSMATNMTDHPAINHVRVPRSDRYGSIWTPSNAPARSFTSAAYVSLFGEAPLKGNGD